jgi:hypothetical protein
VLRQCDPGIVVFALIALPNYFGIVSRLFGIRVVNASQKDVLDTATDLILHGIFPPDSKADNPKGRAAASVEVKVPIRQPFGHDAHLRFPKEKH